MKVEAPTILAVLQEFDAIVKERDSLRRQLDSLQGPPPNQKKLSDREVKEIRNLARVSHMTQREIAECYDVNPGTVSRIVRGIYHK